MLFVPFGGIEYSTMLSRLMGFNESSFKHREYRLIGVGGDGRIRAISHASARSLDI